jgi:hypothetical protein
MTFPSRTSLDHRAQQLTLRRRSTVRSRAPLQQSLEHPDIHRRSDQIIEGVIDLDPHYQRGM